MGITDTHPTRLDRADGVRYAILQRIAPSIRHDIVAHLQPIPMIYEVLRHRSKLGDSVDAVEKCASKMSHFAKNALQSGVSALSWLEREEGLMVPAADGIAETVAMLERSFIFMGFRLVNHAGNPPLAVDRDAMRHALTAALLAAIDGTDAASLITITSSTHAEELVLSVEVTPDPFKATLRPYQEECRHLSWADAKDVAESEGIKFRQQAQGAVLTFPAVAKIEKGSG